MLLHNNYRPQDTVSGVEIAGGVDQVWSVLSDFGEIARWAPNVDHSCLLSSQTAGVDTVRRVQVGRNALVETVTVWEPNEQLAYRIEGLPPVIRSVVTSWQLQEAGGKTLVTVTSEVDAGGRPPQKVIARVVAKQLEKAATQMVQGLDAHVRGTT